MKNYTTPMLNLLMLENEDVIVTSTPVAFLGFDADTEGKYTGGSVDFGDL